MSDRKLKLFESDRTALTTLLYAVYGTDKDYTYASENRLVCQYFKTKHNFYCSDNIAHNIIIKCRNEKSKDYNSFKKVVDSFKESKYPN